MCSCGGRFPNGRLPRRLVRSGGENLSERNRAGDASKRSKADPSAAEADLPSLEEIACIKKNVANARQLPARPDDNIADLSRELQLRAKIHQQDQIRNTARGKERAIAETLRADPVWRARAKLGSRDDTSAADDGRDDANPALPEQDKSLQLISRTFPSMQTAQSPLKQPGGFRRHFVGGQRRAKEEPLLEGVSDGLSATQTSGSAASSPRNTRRVNRTAESTRQRLLDAYNTAFAARQLAPFSHMSLKDVVRSFIRSFTLAAGAAGKLTAGVWMHAAAGVGAGGFCGGSHIGVFAVL